MQLTKLSLAIGMEIVRGAQLTSFGKRLRTGADVRENPHRFLRFISDTVSGKQ